MGFVLDGLDAEAYDRTYSDRVLVRRIAEYFRPHTRTMTLVAGMVNVYCAEIRSRFTYVSDSNGIWWRGRLGDILQNGPDKLHVLTHPEWWTPEAMSPRERIARCIDGRARSQHVVYDQFLMEFMRPNVGAPPAPERTG